MVCFPKTIRLSFVNRLFSPQPQQARSLVWPLSISLAATLKIDFSFSSCCYLDVSVHNVPPAYLFIQYAVTELSSARFPHSDIHESLTVCVSSWLFAAFYVLLRFLMPRHSPFALISLTSYFDIFLFESLFLFKVFFFGFSPFCLARLSL